MHPLKITFVFLVLVVGVAILGSGYSFAQERTLYWGNNGRDVTVLQQQLRNWGYYHGPVDGVFGKVTWQAVINFQRRNGLLPDGIVGVNTWSALGYSPKKSVPLRKGIGGSRGVSNRDEAYLLARVIEGEAANESLVGKVAVGAVILNRLRSALFPHTLPGVIYQYGAFECVSNGQFNRPVSQESLQASVMAMSGWDPTGGALYFWNPSKTKNPWVWARNIVTQIGRHIFAR